MTHGTPDSDDDASTIIVICGECGEQVPSNESGYDGDAGEWTCKACHATSGDGEGDA